MATSQRVPGTQTHWDPVDINQLAGAVVELQGVANGGSIADAPYRLASDGTTVSGYDKTGAVVSSGIDGGAVLTAILALLPAVGGHIEFRNDGNVFPWTTTPALPKNVTGWLTLQGNGSTIKTTNAASPRFLDFNRVADYDTFQNITVDGFVVDANNLGGRHHVIIGSYAGGVNLQRINVQNVRLLNLRAINVLRDSNTGTNHRRGICIVPTDPGGGSTTFLTDILIENCRVDGGNTGFEIATAGTTAVNTLVDRITVRNCYHDTLTVPTAFFASANLQIGGYAYGGRCEIDGFYGANSGDVGIEIDNKTEATLQNVTIQDAWTAAFYATNFTAPQWPNAQIFRYRDCHARKINIGAAGVGVGWLFGGNGAFQMGTMSIEKCAWINTTATFVDGDAINMHSSVPSGGFRNVIINGFRADIEGYDMTTNVTTRQSAIRISAIASTRLVDEIRDCFVYMNGTRHAGSSASFFTHALEFVGNGTFEHSIDGLAVDMTQANVVATATQAINMNGGGASTNTHRGAIRGLKILSIPDTSAIGVRADANSTYDGLLFTECDFAGLPAGGAEFSFSTAADKQNVRFRGNRWKVKPVPVAFTGLVTATGLAVGQGWDALAVFTQGSGVAITAIDVSTNGGTTYTNYLTQASGALPAGFDQALGPLPPDSLIKVTFATTQPTITLVPVNP